jgi:Subtilase family
MWRFWLVVGFGILVGCNQATPARINTLVTRTSVPPVTVAWGERIDLGISIGKVLITYPDNPNATQMIDISQQLFDIPAPPIDSESLGTQTSVSLETYNTALSSTPYTQRATLHVKDNNGKEIATYNPYGSVVKEQISFLASVLSQSCNDFKSQLKAALTASPVLGFSIVSDVPDDIFSINIPNNLTLCSGNIWVGQQTANQALDRLKKILSMMKGYVPALGDKNFVIDKNTVFNLLQIGSWAFDPTCPEIAGKLDPFSNLGLGFDKITTTKLRADLNLPAVVPIPPATQPGAGVNVNIIGGGVDTADTFTCLPGYSFAKHDTHVKSLIQTIAPGVSFQTYTACNSSGTCKGSELGKALMQVLATNPTQPNIINMSLGSALPNNIMFALLELLRVRHNMPVFASGGNAPRAPAQYPASYSSGVAAPGPLSLANVISVASVGWYNGGYRIATFNTRANADVFTQGVNLCPNSVLGNRCLLGQPVPSSLGITGSSFSTAPAVGLMALMIQQKGGKLPADLHACVRNNRKTDSVSGIQYAALMNQPCP